MKTICRSYYWMNGVKQCAYANTTGCRGGGDVECGLFVQDESYKNLEMNIKAHYMRSTPFTFDDYMEKCSKEHLIEMLMECHRIMDSISPSFHQLTDFDTKTNNHVSPDPPQESEQVWTESKVIDFVNWYLRLCKVVSDSNCRFELENLSVIESYLKGDDYKLWWNKGEQPETAAYNIGTQFPEAHPEQTAEEILSRKTIIYHPDGMYSGDMPVVPYKEAIEAMEEHKREGSGISKVEQIREKLASMMFCVRKQCGRCTYVEDVVCENESIRNDIFILISMLEEYKRDGAPTIRTEQQRKAILFFIDNPDEENYVNNNYEEGRDGLDILCTNVDELVKEHRSQVRIVIDYLKEQL